MRIYELFEQTVAPQGTMAAGSQSPMGTTAPTQTSTPPAVSTATNAAQALDPKIGSQIKSNLNNVKDILNQAGGGNIDVAKLTQAMAQNDPSKPRAGIIILS